MEIRTEDLHELVGEELSGITFVRGYLQLQFNPPPLLNAYAPVTVRSGGTSATSGESALANLLIGQIGKTIREILLRPRRALDITLDDGVVISVSLQPEHCVGAEAIDLTLRSGKWIVL